MLQLHRGVATMTDETDIDRQLADLERRRKYMADQRERTEGELEEIEKALSALEEQQTARLKDILSDDADSPSSTASSS